MILVSELSKRFFDHIVFQRINLKVPRGRSIAIMGPSGSGKSVLLKIIAGLIQPCEGQISLKSHNIGMLFQKNALFDSMTIEENLLFPLMERQKITKLKALEKVNQFLEEVGLQGCQELYPAEISGGMQKRLGIARALIVEPEIILYDEPTAGLDPITSRIISNLIKKLQFSHQSTVLTVTNDVQRSYQLADEIYLLARGTLFPGGTPQQIQRSENPSIRQFIYGLRQGPLTSDRNGYEYSV